MNIKVDMGSHIMLDFQCVDTQKFDLSEPNKMMEIIEDGLKLTDCNVCDKKSVVFPDNRGMTIMYLLSESHISVHTFPATKCMTIDFYNCGENSWQNLKNMEDHLCGVFGWKNCAASIMIPRGRGARKLNMNENDIVSSITNNQINMNKVNERDQPSFQDQYSSQISGIS